MHSTSEPGFSMDRSLRLRIVVPSPERCIEPGAPTRAFRYIPLIDDLEQSNMTSNRTPCVERTEQIGERPETSSQNGLGRRAWIKQAATVIGGAAATGVAAPVVSAEAAAPPAAGTRVDTASRD